MVYMEIRSLLLSGRVCACKRPRSRGVGPGRGDQSTSGEQARVVGPAAFLSSECLCVWCGVVFVFSVFFVPTESF